MQKPRIAIFLACAALIALLAAPVSAQPAGGTIAGTVKSSAGSAVAGAPIAVTEQASRATRVVRTNASGVFEAAGLAPGVYQVTADTQGFRLAVRKDVAVAAGDRVVVDFTLEFRFAAETKVTAMKREDTVESTPVSVAAPTEETLRERGAETIEDVAANVAGFSIQNLGPGQSTVAMRGVSSGQIARDQPGVKEQVGAYLDESVISISAVHARPRLRRHVPHRSAPRAAGNAVRLGLPLGHGPLHHEPARARPDEGLRRADRRDDDQRAARAAARRRASTSRSATRPRCARPCTTTTARGTSTPSSPT